MHEAFNPAEPLELGSKWERKRNPFAQVRMPAEEKKISAPEQAKIKRDEDLFVAVMQELIAKGIVLHPNEELPGKLQIGAATEQKKGEELSIGDLHLVVYDETAKKIIRDVQNKHLEAMIEEVPLETMGGKKERMGHEEKLKSMKAMLETQKSRLRLDREKVLQQIAPVQFDSELGERAQFAVENYDAKVRAIDDGLAALANGEVPKQLACIEAMADAQLRAEEDVETLIRSGKNKERIPSLRQRIEAIKETMTDLPKPIVDQAMQKMGMERTFVSTLEEKMKKGLPPEQAGVMRLDLEYMQNANGLPRVAFTRSLFEIKSEAEAALAGMKSKLASDPEVKKQKKRIQMVDEMFARINAANDKIVPLALRGMSDVLSFEKSLSVHEQSDEMKKGMQDLKQGVTPDRKFLQHIVGLQMDAEAEKDEKRVVQIAGMLSQVPPQALTEARNAIGMQRRNDEILRKIQQGGGQADRVA